MLARARTFAVHGVDAIEVAVEADIHPGLPAFTIVGLPDAAVQEARERVRAALVNSGFEFPLRRITVNLAPADLRKAGPGFDLALATVLLAASGQVPVEALDRQALCGELGLDGSVRAVRGAIVIADAARRVGCSGLYVPLANQTEAAMAGCERVFGVESLGQLVRHLLGEAAIESPCVEPDALLAGEPPAGHDMADVRGHHAAKRAIEIAAAGGHNLLMTGSPGSGKLMLARRLPSILPSMAIAEALEATRVHSVAGLLGARALVEQRPFRAPHHSISAPGLVGGGSGPAPGEISLAHNGVLFLDELSEFSRTALESLRQPLEEGFVDITRAQRSARFPAGFMLVAATNPCPCGNYGDPQGECVCHPSLIGRHRARVSGPLLDRIDIMLRVDRPDLERLDQAAESSRSIAARVNAARERQLRRLAGSGVNCNARMTPRQTVRLLTISADARSMLVRAMRRMGLSMRAHDRVLRVSRTIADLAESEQIGRDHIAEALVYRDLLVRSRAAPA